MSDKLGVMLCGHGSRDGEAVREFAVLAGHLTKALPQYPVDFGYLEFATPIIRDGLDRLRERGVSRVLAVPGMLFAAGTLLLVVFAMSSANSKYPITIPLQAGTMRGMKPAVDEKSVVSVKVEDATYRVPGRAMRMKLTIKNNGNSAVRLGEFYTASVRFLDSEVFRDTTGYPEDLLAEDGLSVSDNSAIAPGETRTVEVQASDAAWEVYRLADIIYDPDSRFAGLLFFFDAAGNRTITQIDAPLIPSFM